MSPLRMAGVPAESMIFDDDVWPQIARPLGFDAGMRTLERTIQGVVRKVARTIVESGKTETVRITKENIKNFLPS